MNTMFNLIVLVQVVSAVAIIGLVLIQHGKGADMGAAFGSGASGSLFGASGSSNFMSKATAVAAFLFFSATLALSWIGSNRIAKDDVGVMEKAAKTVPAAPVAPVASAPVAASAAASAASTTTIPK